MTTIKLNIRDTLRSHIGSAITSVPCTVDLEELLDFNDLFQLDVDIHALLAETRQVAVIWSIEDVQSVRPDLNDGQAWEVLQQCLKVHDCEVGFTWLLIRYVADDMFPGKGDGQ